MFINAYIYIYVQEVRLSFDQVQDFFHVLENIDDLAVALKLYVLVSISLLTCLLLFLAIITHITRALITL